VVRIHEGALKLDKTSRNSEKVEEFVAGLRFEQQGKLAELYIDRREKANIERSPQYLMNARLGSATAVAVVI
jgi:hypothetical protein